MKFRCPKCSLLNIRYFTECSNCGYIFTEEDKSIAEENYKNFFRRIKYTLTAKHDTTDSSMHQWSRFTARMIDFMLLSFLSDLLKIFLVAHFFTYIRPFEHNLVSLTCLRIVVNIVTFVIPWIILESLLLSRWGTTPGKKLLQVVVRNSNNGKINFFTAVKRSITLWIFGLGFEIPLLCSIFQIYSYIKINQGEKTKWDRELDLLVTVKPVGVFQMLVVASMIFVIFYMFYAGITGSQQGLFGKC